jgi:Tfp pilus assembly protein PilF
VYGEKMAKKPINPYITGIPVGKTATFVGREDICRDVVRVLENPNQNSLVLFGQRRVGKTSVLQYLESYLPQQGPFIPIIIDLQDKSTWSLNRLLNELSKIIANSLRLPPPALSGSLEKSFRAWLKNTLNDLSKENTIVLLFDEFDDLASPKATQAAAAFFPYLRDLLNLDPQHLKFIFVLGRNIDDLSSIALSVFRGIPTKRLSLLNKKDTFQLIKLSEENKTLIWSMDGLQSVWKYTNGHALFTQALCYQIWEAMHENDRQEPHSVTKDDVECSIPATLESNRANLEWLWKGLRPAERVIAAALAEAGPDLVSDETLEKVLRESGVRVIIRELKDAPKILQDWDLIEPLKKGKYKFRVELLRLWLAENKPLARVQEELDRIQPMAENLYQAATGFYQAKDLEQAADLLQRALRLNPQHLAASELFCEILIAQGEFQNARELLEKLYELYPSAARSRLVQVYLELANLGDKEQIKLGYLEKILTIDPSNPDVLAMMTSIWRERGDEAFNHHEYGDALIAYEKIQDKEKIKLVKSLIQDREIAVGLKKIQALEKKGSISEAHQKALELSKLYPRNKDIKPNVERLEKTMYLSSTYQQALGALQQGNREDATNLLLKVLNTDPFYEDATRLLHLAVKGDEIIVDKKVESKAKEKNYPEKKIETQTLTEPIKKIETQTLTEPIKKTETQTLTEAIKKTERKNRRLQFEGIKEKVVSHWKTYFRGTDLCHWPDARQSGFVKHLVPGTPLKVFWEKNGWYYVNTYSNDFGYVRADHLDGSEKSVEKRQGIVNKANRTRKSDKSKQSLSFQRTGDSNEFRPLNPKMPGDYFKYLWLIAVNPLRFSHEEQESHYPGSENVFLHWISRISMLLAILFIFLAITLYLSYEYSSYEYLEMKISILAGSGAMTLLAFIVLPGTKRFSWFDRFYSGIMIGWILTSGILAMYFGEAVGFLGLLSILCLACFAHGIMLGLSRFPKIGYLGVGGFTLVIFSNILPILDYQLDLSALNKITIIGVFVILAMLLPGSVSNSIEKKTFPSSKARALQILAFWGSVYILLLIAILLSEINSFGVFAPVSFGILILIIFFQFISHWIGSGIVKRYEDKKHIYWYFLVVLVSIVILIGSVMSIK